MATHNGLGALRRLRVHLSDVFDVLLHIMAELVEIDELAAATTLRLTNSPCACAARPREGTAATAAAAAAAAAVPGAGGGGGGRGRGAAG